MTWAWSQDCGSSGEKVVLLALADHANGDGYCWPSMERIAVMAGMTPRSVSRAITKLSERGLVVKADRRRATSGQYRGWSYLVGPVASQQALDDDETRGRERPVASGRQRPVASGRQRPVIEPSERTVSNPLGEGHDRQEPSKAKTRPRDEAFEELARVCGHDLTRLTGAERGRLNRALMEIRGAGGDPEAIRSAAREWRRRYPQATMTPTALAAHWSSLIAVAPSRTASLRCRDCDVPLESHDDEVCRLVSEGMRR